MRNFRLALSVLCAAIACAVNAQIWEKLITPGLTYRVEVDLTIPRILHAFRYTPGASEVRAISQLAHGKVYDETVEKGRAELSTMMQRELAIAGINGDFFPYTGDPIGAMIRSGELLSTPFPNRPVFAWGAGAASTAMLSWKGTVTSDSGVVLKLDGINQDCGNNDLVLSNDVAGLSLAKTPCIYALVECGETNWAPNSENVGILKLLYSDVESMPIQPGNVILAARGKAMSMLAKLKPGDALTFTMETAGLDWKLYENAIGGGPYLIRNSKVHVDWKEQGFQQSFAEKQHPRTAVGKTKDGDVWFVAIDGRQAISEGATLHELAQVMLRLGCSDAINLDGGGSTTVGLHGRVMNRPSDGAQRKIANAILFLTGAIQPAEGDFAIKGPAEVNLTTQVSYKVIAPDGTEVPNSELIWSTSGAGWIDQSGTVRGLATGQIIVCAFVRGRLLELPIKAIKT